MGLVIGWLAVGSPSLLWGFPEQELDVAEGAKEDSIPYSLDTSPLFFK